MAAEVNELYEEYKKYCAEVPLPAGMPERATPCPQATKLGGSQVATAGHCAWSIPTLPDEHGIRTQVCLGCGKTRLLKPLPPLYRGGEK